MEDLRIGILGAAAIAPWAVVTPAAELPGVVVHSVASRDRGRAAAFAAKHDIPRVAHDYDALLRDPDVDAVYIALPNSLHGAWTVRALNAAKHVLCEKPFTSNATEAEYVASVAAASDRVVMEAFHYRYHPLARRAVEVVASGELGEVRRLSASFCYPLPPGRNIRWQRELGGGALMDAGCYAVHFLRSVMAQEPTVRQARAKLGRPGVDRLLRGTLEFPSGAVAEVTTSLWSAHVLSSGLTVQGTRGTLRVVSPLHPQAFHRFVVRTQRSRRVERFPKRSTYGYQLEAFRDAVRTGAPVLTGPADAVRNMTVIDALYRAAGLEPRSPWTSPGPVDAH
jgi:predicted dehydrogenase